MDRGPCSVVRAGSVVLLALVVGATAGGCRSVSVTRDELLRSHTVEVHLVGVNRAEYRQWHDIPMDDYWKPSCQLRKQAVAQGYARVMVFRESVPEEKVLEATDPIWKEVWQARKAEDLFVLADLTGNIQKGAGSADARRKIHPLAPWPPLGRLSVRVGPGGIVLQNPRAGERK